MPDIFFRSAVGTDLIQSLRTSLDSERILWSGRCAVAEYAFEEPASLPRWTLPEETEVIVTETRVAFVDPSAQSGGELHWPWPQHLRVQPGNRDTGRSATVTQIQLVCAGPDGAFPALVFAGGDLSTVGDADKLANVLRQSIARFRVEYSTDLGLTAPQARMLSRLVIGPEFTNYQGGQGQTVSLLGAIPIDQPVDDPVAQQQFLDDYRLPYGYPATAEQYAPHPYHPAGSAGWDEDAGAGYPAPGAGHPAPPEPVRAAEYSDLASRAADLAARVASLVSANAGLEPPFDRFETQTTNLSAFLTQDNPAGDYARGGENRAGENWVGENRAGENQTGENRAETIRRTAARFAGNSARARTTGQRPAGDDHSARRHNS